MSRRQRLDVALVERGLVESREKARRLILAGKVHSENARLDKPGMQVAADLPVFVDEPDHPYVSRGGLKLEAALKAWRLDPAGMICADLGSSTGGFTDCLLQHGARKVYAFDVGKGQLHWKLRQDERVEVHEGINIRYLDPGLMPEPVQLISVDLSFISLVKALPGALPVLAPEGIIAALVKPQFEAGKGKVGKGGILRDPAEREKVLREHIAGMAEIGLAVVDLIPSPIRGGNGNREYLSLLVLPERLAHWRKRLDLPLESYPAESDLRRLAWEEKDHE